MGRGEDSLVPPADVAPPQAGLRCGFAGVDFILEGEGLHAFAPPAVYGEYLMPEGSAPMAAQVRCQLVPDHSLGQPMGGLNQLSWTFDAGGHCSLRGSYMRADLARSGPQRYHGQARFAPDAWGAAAVLRYIAAALVEAQGGLNLHAAAVDLDGYAVAFTGPSGAGKSTACDLAPSARCLAYDQLAVYRSGGQVYAWALPWGKSSRLPRSSACVRPLRAVLRVVRGTERSVIRPAGAASALFVLREATTVTDGGLEAERRRLDAAFALMECVAVGHIETVLGCPIDALLRQEFFASCPPQRTPSESLP